MSKIYTMSLRLTDKNYKGGRNFPPRDKYFPSLQGKIVVDSEGVVRGYSEEVDKRLEGYKGTSCLFGLVTAYETNKFGVVFAKITDGYRFTGVCVLADITNPDSGLWYDRSTVCYMGFPTDAEIVLTEIPYSEKEEKAIIKRFERRFKTDLYLCKYGLSWIDREWLNRCEFITLTFAGERIYGEYNTRDEYWKSGATKRTEAKLAGKKDLFDLE